MTRLQSHELKTKENAPTPRRISKPARFPAQPPPMSLPATIRSHSMNPTAAPDRQRRTRRARTRPSRRRRRSRRPGRGECECQSRWRSISTAAQVTTPTAASVIIASRKSIIFAPIERDSASCPAPDHYPSESTRDTSARLSLSRETGNDRRLARVASGKMSNTAGRSHRGSTPEGRGKRIWLRFWCGSTGWRPTKRPPYSTPSRCELASNGTAPAAGTTPTGDRRLRGGVARHEDPSLEAEQRSREDHLSCASLDHAPAERPR